MRWHDCIVIGGGLVGAAIAHGLVGRGLRSLILDEGDIALRASRGNFGLVWVQGKGKGRPEYVDWSLLSSELWTDFSARLREETGIETGYKRTGGVMLALSEAEQTEFVDLLDELRTARGNKGYSYEILQNDELGRYVPGVGPEVVGGTYCPYDGAANPLWLLRALHEAYLKRGGAYRANHAVESIEALPGGGFRVGTNGGAFEAQKVVLAAGLGTRELAKAVDLDVPVAPLHGQLMVTERLSPVFDMPTNIARQTAEGTFLLGYSAADLGYEVETHPQYMRDIAWRAQRAFPFLRNVSVNRSWAALRVMTPDGFPIYDESPTSPGAYAVACHSGVTLAAVHSERLAGWIADGGLPEDMACFRSQRFDVQASS